MKGYTEATEDWWRDQQDAEEERRREETEDEADDLKPRPNYHEPN